MKAVLLFPGLDALFQTSKLKRWLDFKPTCDALDFASGHLEGLSGQKEDLRGFLASSERPHVKDFDRTLITLTALQVGIAQALKGKKDWDLILGCSHGDIARSVIAEVISFETAIEVLWTFSLLRQKCPEGYAASVRATEGELTAEHITWLEENNAPVSLWSSEQATVAGSTDLMLRLSQEGRARGLKIKPVLRYPVHSPAMTPLVEELVTYLPRWQTSQPRWPIFSSVTIDYLRSPQDIVAEALTGAVSAIKWTQSLCHLHDKDNVTQFINVGPCNSLTGWMLSSEHLKNATLVDSWDVLVFNSIIGC